MLSMEYGFPIDRINLLVSQLHGSRYEIKKSHFVFLTKVELNFDDFCKCIIVSRQDVMSKIFIFQKQVDHYFYGNYLISVLLFFYLALDLFSFVKIQSHPRYPRLP